jgi:ATP phosphoribosyltransferase
MRDIITIGLPSKGRLKESALDILEKNNFKIISKGGNRNYFASLKNYSNTKIIYLHAREIIERLGDGTLDFGISGLDLLNESSINLQKRIEINKRLNFGKADLVVAVPNDWIDVQTIADLEEVSFYFRDKKNLRLRVATKYPNLTNKFFTAKGVTQYRLISSLGATETYPFTGSSEIITDITSTGNTLMANNLRVLKDGFILKSYACILASKKSLKDLKKKNFLKLLGKIG